MPNEHLPPLGLLSIGDSLLDAGYYVNLLVVDSHHYAVAEAVEMILDKSQMAIRVQHPHSIINDIRVLMRRQIRKLKLYRVAFSIYHWQEVLEKIHRSILLFAAKEGRYF